MLTCSLEASVRIVAPTALSNLLPAKRGGGYILLSHCECCKPPLRREGLLSRTVNQPRILATAKANLHRQDLPIVLTMSLDRSGTTWEAEPQRCIRKRHVEKVDSFPVGPAASAGRHAGYSPYEHKCSTKASICFNVSWSVYHSLGGPNACFGNRLRTLTKGSPRRAHSGLACRSSSSPKRCFQERRCLRTTP